MISPRKMVISPWKMVIFQFATWQRLEILVFQALINLHEDRSEESERSAAIRRASLT